MPEAGHEVSCEIINMSASGIAVMTDRSPASGQNIVTYIEHLGRFEGKVVRKFAGGFAAELRVRAAKRSILNDNLLHLSTQQKQFGHTRLHQRIVPNNTRTTVTLEDGILPARIIDFSRSGVGLLLPLPVAIGTAVLVGTQVKGRVTRLTDRVTGIEFYRLLPIQDVTEQFEF